jgi:hypothetical protein
MNELAYRQNIVVKVPGNTRFYTVLEKPGDRVTADAEWLGSEFESERSELHR